MNPRKVSEIIDEMYNVVERSWHLPMSGGRAMVDSKEIVQLLEEMKESLPKEIQQARGIVADRNQIIADAKREAESIVRTAEQRAKELLEEHEVTKRANMQAENIKHHAQQQATAMEKACREFVDSMLTETEQALGKSLSTVQEKKQQLKSFQFNRQ